MKCKFHSCTKDARENPYKGHDPEFCSTACKSKFGVNAHRLRRKQWYVDYKGGQCCVCGYDKCVAALHFHHLDPTIKEFEITRVLTLRIDEVIPELDKCILVCSNCHIEIHQGLIKEYKI